MAGLNLADKAAALAKLAAGVAGRRDELRLERLILSVAAGDLSRFKFGLEYDLDYKDLEEYVFHDVDSEERQDRILAHLTSAPASRGIKVLSDVDDTMHANFLERRYGKGHLYPGVL